MKPSTLILPVVFAVTIAVVAPAPAVVIPGGRNPKSDCYVGFEVEGTSNSSGATANGTRKAEQPACGGSCTFTVQTCLNEPVGSCTAASVNNISVKTRGVTLPLPPLPGSAHACGDAATFTVALKGKKQNKPGKMKIKVVSASDGKPRNDRDILVLRCLPNPDNTGCGTTTTTICPTNPAGGPDRLVFTVLGNGTDLDNGWTGTSHNFPVIKDAALVYCLSGCDASTNPVCTTDGPTGPGSANSVTFGPPLPLIAGGVAVCVINRFQTQSASGITGTIHLDTGESSGSIDLFSDVFITDTTRVCPRCETGTCDSGANRGKACHADGSVPVVKSLASNKTFKLSKDCPPGGNAIATLNIPLRPTTGTVSTPGTGGSKPCRENEAHGVTVKDDNCGPAGCGTDNCTGDACVNHVDDPSMPGHMICVDAKGGLSQGCCISQTATPCFGTATTGITRVGHAVVAQPAWPDPTYPKAADGEVLVSTFCEAATGAFNVDSVTGLPGPGAVTFNLHMDVIKQ